MFGAAMIALLMVRQVGAEETLPILNEYYIKEMKYNEEWERAGELEEKWADLVPPECPGIVAMIHDPDRLRDQSSNSEFVGLRPCLLYVFHKLAEPFTQDDFPKDEPMLLVWRRLDWRHFPHRMGKHWDLLESPVYLKDIARGVGFRKMNPRWGRGPLRFYMTVDPKLGPNRTWSSEFYGRADWTGDGRADLLISWDDTGMPGTWDRIVISRMLLLVRDGPDGDVRAIDYADWFLENKERVLAAFTDADR